MGEYTAFFYGTLMAPQVLNRVCFGNSPSQWQLRCLRVRPAILRDHCRHRVRGHDYPGLIPSPSEAKASVRGTYVTGLTQGDIWRLDIFEGDEYSRQKVSVRLLDETISGARSAGDEREEEVETETYLWTAGDHFLEDGEWDFAHFQKEKMQRWVCEYPSFADVDDAMKKQGEAGESNQGQGFTIDENDTLDEKDVSRGDLRSAV